MHWPKCSLGFVSAADRNVSHLPLHIIEESRKQESLLKGSVTGAAKVLVSKAVGIVVSGSIGPDVVPPLRAPRTGNWLKISHGLLCR